MRIIAGSYRGRVLKSPSDRKTRPTSDRLRETIFNILAPRITPDTQFLDLCAGTGAIGIEALSRGAGFVTFVDKSRRACALIEENLDLLSIPESETEVLSSSADKFLIRNKGRTWDIIYFDPPYTEDYLKVIALIGEAGSGMLSDQGVFVAEHHSKNPMPDESGSIRRWRIVKQGESRLSFYEKN